MDSQSSEFCWKEIWLLLGAVMLFMGCASVDPLPSSGFVKGSSSVHGSVSLPPSAEFSPKVTLVSLVRPMNVVAHAVVNTTKRLDSFEELLALAGQDNMEDFPASSASLSPQEAARVLASLMHKPVTLASFPPRMAVGYLLREVLTGGEVSREELLQRVERFTHVAVLRPDGCLAWTRTGRTQQRAGPVEWKDGTLHAGPFAMGFFYTGVGGIFRRADAQLRPLGEGVLLAEVYDDEDAINRTLDGAQEAFVELYQAMEQLFTRTSDKLVALEHLPTALVALIASSPAYLEHFRYMTRGEQVKALSKLTTNLLVTWGTVGTTRALTAIEAAEALEAAVPVLSLSAQGELIFEQLVLPVGQLATVINSGAGAALIFSQVQAVGSNGGGTRVSGGELERLRKEFETVKSRYWRHEAETRSAAYSPENLARMKQGKPPIGGDGFPMELHHKVPLAEGGSNAFENLAPMTRTEHRLGLNYKLNHPGLP